MNTYFLLLVVTALIVHSLAEEENESRAQIAFNKLTLYTSLAKCMAKIHENFAFCNNKAEEESKAFLEGIDQNSEWAKRVKCCGTWNLRDCWVKFAKQNCDPKQAVLVHYMPYKFIKNLEQMCREYPPESEKCRFPVWE